MAKATLRVILVVAVLALVSGCAERRRSSEEFNKLSRAFEFKMEKGETTRDQEQAYVRATSKLAYELDRSIRGDKKADRARKEAEAILNGFKPSDPLRMDPDKDVRREDRRDDDPGH